MSFARHTGAYILANGQDVTGNISNFLRSITYTDNLSGEADVGEIELEDAERVFISEWFPKRGDTASIILWREFWNGGSEIETLPLGTCEVDEVTVDYPPSTAKVKLNSIPNNSKLRSVDKSKSWENFRLSQIAQDIAKTAGVELFYDTKEDPVIKRAEQSELSCLKFLQKLCTDNGLALKFTDGKLIIFDEEKYEQQEPIVRFVRDMTTIKRFSGTATINQIYSAAHVKYKQGKEDKFIDATFTDSTREAGMTLEINQKVETQAEAEKLAKKKLREKNREEVKVSLTVTGDFRLLSGRVVELVEHGFFSGRYIIEKAVHRIGNSGYEVNLDLRKCLKGY